MLAILSTSQLLDDSAVPSAAAGSATDTATAAIVARSSDSARQLQFSAVSPSSCFKIDQTQLVHATVREVTIHTLLVLHNSSVVRKVKFSVWLSSHCQYSRTD
jgi:hypothetical protein